MRPDEPVAPGVAVADRIAERQAAGLALGGQRLRNLQHAVEIGRPGVEAGFLESRDPIDDPRAGGAERNGDPFAVAHSELAAHVVPAAIFLIEIFAEIGQIDELVGILMRIVIPAVDDIGAFADIGGNRRLGAQIFPALALDLDLDAGLPWCISRCSRATASHRRRRTSPAAARAELAPSSGFRSSIGSCARAGRRKVRADGGAGKHAGAEFQRVTSCKFLHSIFLPGNCCLRRGQLRASD